MSIITKIVSVSVALLIQLCALTGLPFLGKETEMPVDFNEGGDPFMVEDGGYTYYMYTLNDRIDIIKIASPEDTAEIERKTVYRTGQDGVKDNIWAPEIFRIGEKWYIISCGVFVSETVPRGAMPYGNTDEDHGDYYRYGFVLESKTDDIMGEYEFKGILAPDGLNNIDGTYFKHGEKLYYVCSAYLNIGHQCIYIAEMENPYTLKSGQKGAMISEPEYNWEKRGWWVNEGPAALYKGDSSYLVYSASGYSSGRYCMGILTLSGNDPMNPRCWIKSAIPFFSKNTTAGLYHTGHCSFLYRDDGIYMVFHATDSEDFDKKRRCTYIRKLNFIGDCPVSV